jgi:hypothetical protein
MSLHVRPLEQFSSSFQLIIFGSLLPLIFHKPVLYPFLSRSGDPSMLESSSPQQQLAVIMRGNLFLGSKPNAHSNVRNKTSAIDFGRDGSIAVICDFLE